MPKRPNVSLLEPIRAGKTRRVRKLLEAGAPVDRRDEADITPLMVAACCGRSGIARELLRRGADPNGATTARTQEASSRRDVASVLGLGGAVGVGRGETPLYFAARQGKHEVVELLLEASARVDPVSGHRWTPLLAAVYAGHRQVAGALLRHGADADHLDAEQLSPLFYAARAGDEELVAALLERGADATYESPFGDGALATAARLGYAGVARLLEERGATLRQIDLGQLASPGADRLREKLGELFELELRSVPPHELASQRSRLLNDLMVHLGLHGIGDRWRRLDWRQCVLRDQRVCTVHEVKLETADRHTVEWFQAWWRQAGPADPAGTDMPALIAHGDLAPTCGGRCRTSSACIKSPFLNQRWCVCGPSVSTLAP